MGPASAMMSAKAEEIRRLLSDPVVDLWKLREMALTEGGLVNDSLRKLAWPKLVGVSPDLNTPSPTVSQSVPPASEVSIPPSLDSEQIERDVSRVTWHLLTGNQRSRNFQMKNKHRKRIGTLLKKKQRRLGDFLNLVLVQSYGDLGEREGGGEEDRLRYYQGYHDIASIFLSALGGATSVETTLPIEGGSGKARYSSHSYSSRDSTVSTDVQKAHTAAASMGLTLACQVLLQVSHSHYRDAMRANFQQLNAALRLIIMPLTAAFDAEVHSHLFDCEMEPFFALSWIITWFAHDVRDTSLVKRLFDFFIASHPLMSIYMSVAMMIHPLNRIEILGTDCDFACVHNALADLPKNSSNVGWKYTPRDGGYVSGDEDDASATEGSLLDQSCDEPEEEGSQISNSVLNNPRNARVPFQELIDLSILLMHKIPPRNLISLAKRYHTKVTLQPLMAEASTIALLQPPPSHCLASYVDSDWVLRQKLREEHGIKLNRHQRKNRFKLVNTDVEYQGDDDITNSLESFSSNDPATLPKKPPFKAVIASGTGPDGRAEERRIRKRRRVMVRSVAVVLLSVFAAMVKSYFSSPILNQTPQCHKNDRELSPGKELVCSTVSDVTRGAETCHEGDCREYEKPSIVSPEDLGVADKPEYSNVKINLPESEDETTRAVASGKDVSVCADNEANAVEPKPSYVGTTQVSIVPNKERKRTQSPELTHHLLNIADHLLTSFYYIEPYLEVFLLHAVKIFQIGWHRTEWILSKIAPVAEKGLILELDDGSSAGWEDVAQKTWNKQAVMYQNQWKRVAKVATEIVRKGSKSGRDPMQGLVNDVADALMRRTLKQASGEV
eukprot:CCRYP_009876-RA/>CCRYP_009876-RA protein AED:0.05 eAED:0.05 QI:245/1/1/1/1/1/4/142/837